MTYQDFDTDDEYIAYYNQWRDENRYGRYHMRNELYDVVGDMTARELIDKLDDRFDLSHDDYFYFTGNGYIRTIKAQEIIDEAEDEQYFLDWLAEK